ncbi:MAG: hypothetical protein FK733_17730 [Asgard group archaeon]|nr:hypothetical protein [Asgard group archaeon]
MKVIMHNSVSVDMSMKGMPVDLATHYSLVSKFKPDVYMFGSISAIVAIDSGMSEADPNSKIVKKEQPYWVIVDSKGKLENKLHIYRNSPYAGKLIILVSDNSPESYYDYLEENNYNFIKTGKVFVDYPKALDILEKKYNVKTIVLDSGGLLNRFFFELNLIDELSLVVNPYITGKKCTNLFREITDLVKLELIKMEKMNEVLWLHYSVKN